MAKKSKFITDDEDLEGIVVEKRAADGGEELTDEEREFLKWTDEMDAADADREHEVKARQDGLREFRERAKSYLQRAVGSRFDGLSTADLARRVVVAAATPAEPAPTAMSDSYAVEYARARLDEMSEDELDPDGDDELEEEQTAVRDEIGDEPSGEFCAEEPSSEGEREDVG